MLNPVKILPIVEGEKVRHVWAQNENLYKKREINRGCFQHLQKH